MTDDYKKGFADQTKEITVPSLEVEGIIPDWLSGTLVRNGPARFHLEDKTLNHWFDGLAMLHKFDIADGHVGYANKFLDTPAFRAAKDGKMKYAEFATDPCRNLFRRIAQIFTGSASGANANVSIGRIADEFVAQTESPMPVAFDKDTLKTIGIVSYSDKLKGQLTTAHPHYDQDSHEAFNYLLNFGFKSTYNIYMLSDGSKKRQPIGSYSTNRPSYMHSFGLSQNYVILMEFPLVVNPLSMLIRGKPFIANYTWEPQRGTRFSLVDRRTGEVKYAHTDEAWFGFHHVNAVDREGKIDLDIIVYPNADVVQHFYLNSLLNRPNQEAYPKTNYGDSLSTCPPGPLALANWLTTQLNCRALIMSSTTAKRTNMSTQAASQRRGNPPFLILSSSLIWRATLRSGGSTVNTLANLCMWHGRTPNPRTTAYC